MSRPKRRPIKNPRHYEVIGPGYTGIASFTDKTEHEVGDILHLGETFWLIQKRSHASGGIAILECVEVGSIEATPSASSLTGDSTRRG